MHHSITANTSRLRLSALAFLLTSASGIAVLAGCGSGSRTISVGSAMPSPTPIPSGLAAEYVATDIGAPSGYMLIYAAAVNNSGQVVSEWLNSREQTHGFIYTPGSGFIDVGVLGGAGQNDDVFLYAINNKGQAAGYIGASPGRPILYSNGRVTELSGSLPNYGSIRGISDSGQIVGMGDLTGSPDAAHPASDAFSYTPRDGVQDISLLIPNQTFSTVDAVNNSGLVVGNYTSNYSPNGSQVESQLFEYANGKVTTLTSLQSFGAGPLAVNSSGQITGQTTAYFQDGKLIKQHAFLYSNGALQALGGYEGAESIGNGISDSGVVVGYSYIDQINTAAYAWYNGKMTNLNTITTGLNGCTLAIADGISGNGIILAYGTDSNGVRHVFTLRPAAGTKKATERPVELRLGVPREAAEEVSREQTLRLPFPRSRP